MRGLPVPIDISGFGGLQVAGLELLYRLGNRSARAGVYRDIACLQGCERLGTDVPRDQRANSEFDDSSCLPVCPPPAWHPALTLLPTAENAPVSVSITARNAARPKRGSTADCILGPCEVTTSFI